MTSFASIVGGCHGYSGAPPSPSADVGQPQKDNGIGALFDRGNGARSILRPGHREVSLVEFLDQTTKLVVVMNEEDGTTRCDGYDVSPRPPARRVRVAAVSSPHAGPSSVPAPSP